MKKKIYIPLIAVGLICAIVFLLPASPKYRERTLASGFVVKIKSTQDLSFPNGDSRRLLNYYTDIDIKNLGALQDEAEDIWKEFRLNVEKDGFKSASMCPTEMPKRLISMTEGFMFHYEQQSDGSWILKNSQK
jgi:hypothetical protein